jgi:hypothetical protein
MNDGLSKAHKYSKRIDELNGKATQILLFLSFAMISVATLENAKEIMALHPTWPRLLDNSFFFWKIALIPTLICILPVKGFHFENDVWYHFLVKFKGVLLWASVSLIGLGIYFFVSAS